MKVRQWITGIVLFLLVAAAIVGMVWTRELPAPNEEASTTPADTTPANKVLGKKPPVTPRPLVDQRPLQTARRMAALAGTPEEQALGVAALLGAAVLVVDRLQIFHLRHMKRTIEALDDPPREADVIGMRMGDDDASQGPSGQRACNEPLPCVP